MIQGIVFTSFQVSENEKLINDEMIQGSVLASF